MTKYQVQYFLENTLVCIKNYKDLETAVKKACVTQPEGTHNRFVVSKIEETILIDGKV
jgi:hypothetical protein